MNELKLNNTIVETTLNKEELFFSTNLELNQTIINTALNFGDKEIVILEPTVEITSLTKDKVEFKTNVNKFVVSDNGNLVNTILLESNLLLAPGNHNIKVEAYDGAALVKTSTRNFNVEATSPYDADYQAKLNKATELGIPHPSESQSAIYSQRITNLKTTDGWDKSAVVCDYSGVADIQFKLLCIKRRVLTVAYGGGVWSSDGWKANGVNAYIDLLYDTNDTTDWKLNDAGVSWLSFSRSSKGAIVGSYKGTNDTYTYIAPNGGSRYAFINGFNSVLSFDFAFVGFNSVCRNKSTAMTLNGVDVLGDSIAKTSGRLLLGARDMHNGTLDSFTNAGISFLLVGGAITHSAVKPVLEA